MGVSQSRKIDPPFSGFRSLKGWGSVVDPGEGPPLFLDQTEAQRAKKIFLDWSSAFSQGQDDCPPPLISRFKSTTGDLTS